jgi:hypothetical protein
VVPSVGEESLRTNQPNYREGYRGCCDPPSQQTADHGCDERDDEVGVEVPEGRALLRASRKQEALPIMSYRSFCTAMHDAGENANRGQVVDDDCDARREKGCGEPVEACPWWAGGGWDR